MEAGDMRGYVAFRLLFLGVLGMRIVVLSLVGKGTFMRRHAQGKPD